MQKLNEIIDSLNDENVEEIKEQLKSEADALSNNNKQLYERAKKAEGFEKNAEGEWVKKEEPKVESESKKLEEPEPPKKDGTSNEIDYREKLNKLTLKTEGITHPDDQKVVLDEAKRLNLDVEEIVAMEHIKSRLAANKNQRDTAEAMPNSKGKSGGDFKGEVDYWVDRKNSDGTYQTPDDLELAEKVIDARVKQQKTGQQFEPIRV